MKQLTTQSWELINEDEEKITLTFERYRDGVQLSIQDAKSCISLEQKQIQELKQILQDTKFIFNQ